MLVNEKLDPSFDPVRRAVNLDLDSARVSILRIATAHDRHRRFTTVADFRRAHSSRHSGRP